MKIVGNIMHPVATAGNDAMEAAAKATVDWNSKCAIPQTLYRVISGMPIGTMTVSMRAENWAALSAGVTPMYVDEGQIALQKELGEYLMAPPESSVGNVLHMAGTMPSAPTDIISQTGARPIDNLAAGAWMIDMSNYINQLTGLPNIVMQYGYGVADSTIQPGSMAIVVYNKDTAEHDEATDKLQNDEGYLRRMASVAELFDMSSYFNILMRKLV